MGPGPKPQRLDLTVELPAARRPFLTSRPRSATLLHPLLLLTPVTVIPNWIEVPHQPLPHSCAATLEIDISPGSPSHSRTHADNEFPVRRHCCNRFAGKTTGALCCN